jgi:hypothetical protein
MHDGFRSRMLDEAETLRLAGDFQALSIYADGAARAACVELLKGQHDNALFHAELFRIYREARDGIESV